MNNAISHIEFNDVIIPVDALKEFISKYKMCIPSGHKIVYVPEKVSKITYVVGRFLVTQELTNGIK